MSTTMLRVKIPALIVGGGVTALGILRNLGRNGIDAYCVNGSWSDAFSSKYCQGYTIIPGITDDLQALRAFLLRFQKNFSSKIVIFPTNDPAILNFSRMKETLDGYLSSVPEYEVLETLLVKRKLYHSLREHGVPHPLTIFPDLSKNTPEFDDAIPFPVFVKPSLSPSFFRQFGTKGFVAHSREELARYLQLARSRHFDVVIQQIVPGPIGNYYSLDGYFDRSSNPLILFARRVVRKPHAFDNSSSCISVPLSHVSEMRDVLVSYLRSIGYHGIFQAEFKQDTRDNVMKLLEVNARSWWYNSFPTACGANIILTSYLDAIGTEVKPVTFYETGVKFFWLLRDLRIFWKGWRKGEVVWSDWVSSYRGRKHWIYYARDDTKPFLVNLLARIRDKI